MRFAILGDPEPENSPKEAPIAEPESEQKIPYEQLVKYINDFGIQLADDDKISIEEKMERWTEYLKGIYPLIEDQNHKLKSEIKESIENPSEWDFMERPKRATVQRGKAFHFSPRSWTK